jgi:DNA-binding transcriptional LysR family regulator
LPQCKISSEASRSGVNRWSCTDYEQFDLRLFERSASGMTLTVAGRALLAHAHRVLAAADELRRAAKRLRGEVAGALRIGTVSDPGSIRVGQLLAHAVERHPNLELQLQHETSGAVLEHVREGRLDASFYFGDAPGPEFSSLRLRQFHYCITAPAAWRDQLRDARWSDIAGLPWILTPANSTHNRLVTELLAEHGLDAALRTTLWFVCSAERADDPLLHVVFDILHQIWRDERAVLLRGPAASEAPGAVAAAR